MKNQIIDINESTIKKFVESLRPEKLEIREQIDMGYSYDGKIAILFEIRPHWRDETKKLQSVFAKIRYTKSKKEWSLYWMRASGKWELYEPFSKSDTLDKIIDVVKNDNYGCFFG
ncbi:MAG: DUF3024 domain-containing protein [Flavobacteriales bacterium]